jgi:methyltransferase (TIGR00027 family)
MRKSSRTAIGVAALRAAHQLVDAEPRILEDPVILRLLGRETLDTIQEDRDRYQTPAALALRSHVVMRSRYAEDRLAQAVARGVTQYVILGAGLDTFAYRQPAWARNLRIVEIDRAPMQREKRERLSLAQVFVPDNVTFGAMDFESESEKIQIFTPAGKKLAEGERWDAMSGFSW